MSEATSGFGTISSAATDIASSSGDQWNQFAQFLFNKREADRQYELQERADQRSQEEWDLQKLLMEMQNRQARGNENWSRDFRNAMARGATVQPASR